MNVLEDHKREIYISWHILVKFEIVFIKFSFVKYVWACAHEHTRTSKKIHNFEMVFQLHLLPVNIIFEIIIKNYSCKFLSNGNWKESRIAKRKNHQKFTRYKNCPQLSHIISVIIIQNNIYFQLFIIMLYEMIFAYWNGREQQTDIKKLNMRRSFTQCICPQCMHMNEPIKGKLRKI